MHWPALGQHAPERNGGVPPPDGPGGGRERQGERMRD
jgi:hypothetical protein